MRKRRACLRNAGLKRSRPYLFAGTFMVCTYEARQLTNIKRHTILSLPKGSQSLSLFMSTTNFEGADGKICYNTFEITILKERSNEGSQQEKNILKGTLILTFAALLIKILSAFYRIPFQNIVGDVGFYIYQQVYPFYGIAVALSTYGFPIVISKLYTEEMAKEEQRNVKQLLLVSAVFLSAFGFLCFALLYGGAGWLANYMKDPGLTILFRMVSVVFLIMPVLSLLRGYFQGNGRYGPYCGFSSRRTVYSRSDDFDFFSHSCP